MAPIALWPPIIAVARREHRPIPMPWSAFIHKLLTARKCLIDKVVFLPLTRFWCALRAHLRRRNMVSCPATPRMSMAVDNFAKQVRVVRCIIAPSLPRARPPPASLPSPARPRRDHAHPRGAERERAKQVAKQVGGAMTFSTPLHPPVAIGLVPDGGALLQNQHMP